MRTPFCERCLFYDTSQKHDTSFLWNRKESGKSKTEGERERVRGRVWQRKGCGAVHKIDHWSSIYDGLEKG